MRQTLKIESKKPFRIYLPRQIIEDLGFSGECQFYVNDAIITILHPNADTDRVVESLGIMEAVVRHHATARELVNARPEEKEPAVARP